MRTRIAAVAICAGVLAFGFGPGLDAAPSQPHPRRLLCGGVNSLDIGFCLDNPLPWSADLTP